MAGIPINSGTGPSVSVDPVGTDNYQVVKIVQGASGTTGGGMAAALAISGSMSIINTPTVTVSNSITFTPSGTQNVSVVNHPAYIQGATSVGATATGAILMGLQATTSFAVGISGSNAMLVSVANPSAIGGGVQYVQAATTIAATGTGTLIFGVQSTTAFAVGISGSNQMIVSIGNTSVTITGTVGALMLQKLDNTNDTILVYGAQTGSSINQPIAVSTTGGLYIASGGGGGAQYAVGSTAMGATGTGTLMLGMQTGSTAGQAIAVSTTGYQYTLRGAQPTRFQAFVLATTSAGAGVIVKTSGANTLYITDLLINVAGPMNVLVCSETTTMAGPIYLASQGGFTMGLVQPLVCTTAQSLRVILSSSGSCSVLAVGYTVT